MYNGGGQPPARPPTLPPFPPTFNPSAPPTGFPPFRPPGFPPFPPPNLNGAPPPTLANGAVPLRPPPAGLYPPRPAHPGLGAGALPNLPAGLPQPPHLAHSSSSSSMPNFRREVKTTSIFVGGISPGITDYTLTELLNACGPLHELKRVVGAGGKPQAFGFASFESPEVVLRTIRCLNGVELPDLSPEGKGRKPAKPLVVKADQKTTEFLEEFESTLGRSDSDETADAASRKSISRIVALLTDPNAFAPNVAGRKAGGRSPIEVIVPAHLQDLKEGDLPEDQRVVVLDQIAIFRENSARREREKLKLDEEKEMFNVRNGTGPSGYGYHNRGNLARGPDKRQWGGPQQQQGQQQQPSPNHNQNQSQNHNGAGPSNGARDPQGYQDPVSFVRAQAVEAKGESERTDEEEEEYRKMRRDRERDGVLRDREHRVENRERQRIDSLNREAAGRKQQVESEERNRRHFGEILENWDDDERIERGRELFYSDRARWRQQRQSARTREYQDDVRDRQQEEDELKILEKESEEFLQKQLKEMEEMENAQKRKGLLSDDAAPVRLDILSNIKPEIKEEKPKIEAPVVKPPTAFVEEEEDEEETSKKKRTLVKLEYGDGRLTEAEKIAKRNAKLLEIRSGISKDRKVLWGTRIEWAALSEAVIKSKIQPFVSDKIKEFLGDADEDLVDFVIENIREKKGPDDLVDGLEPVLAEEATPMVIQLWRLLAFESAAYIAGLETGTMMV